jgi:hypothetical protein
MLDITKDVNGKQSSKRTAGLIILLIGVALMTAIGIYSFFNVLADQGTAFNASIALLTVGGGLLGFTIAEYLNKK